MTSPARSSRPHRPSGRSRRRGAARTPGRDLTARYRRTARLTASEVLTRTGTIRLHFEVVDGEVFDFVPGQFVAIDVNDPHHGYRRSPYCLLDGSEESGTFELLIRRVDDGPVSLFLADLDVGDTVSFRGPNGHSMLPTTDHTELVMIATGVGVSPCYCLARRLQALGLRREITMFWGLREADDICLETELDSLGDDFTYSITLSSPTDAWSGLEGRVTESVPPLLETLSDKQFYLVSNGAMIVEMSKALQNLGVSRERIYEESFFDHRYRPDPHTIDEIESRFVATDVERPIDRLERELSRYRISGQESN